MRSLIFQLSLFNSCGIFFTSELSVFFVTLLVDVYFNQYRQIIWFFIKSDASPSLNFPICIHFWFLNFFSFNSKQSKWVSNCVGKLNHRYFYLFLVFTAFTAIYVFTVSISCLALRLARIQPAGTAIQQSIVRYESSPKNFPHELVPKGLN